MLMFRLKSFWHEICYKINRHRIQFIFTGIAIIAVVAIFFGTRAFSTIRENQNTRAQEQALYEFINQPNENYLYDFNYLMQVLEENWPFFSLSYSANGVDVHEVADRVRSILSDPATPEKTVYEFMDFLRVNFTWKIGRIGHLTMFWQYQSYFDSIQANNRIARNSGGTTPLNVAASQAIERRPEVVKFYETLRDIGGSTLSHPDTSPTPEQPLPVYYTAILEEGRIGYVQVTRMMNLDEDRRQGNMGIYERILYEFHAEIEGFEHLIIDLRGNSGGIHLHFDYFVMSPILRYVTVLPAYIFYKDGEYSHLARQNHDLRMIGIWWPYEEVRAYPEFPLPYMEFPYQPYVVHSLSHISPGYVFVGGHASAREEVLFDGKIWVLIDDRTMSAAESSVAMLKLNDLATVVGEPTYGIMGTWTDPTSTMFALPNTGIIWRIDISYFTDLEGRPLQGYGISPHYHNRPGMDALESVLAMIEEIGGN